MTQPKIQQWQTDVVGSGGPIQYFGSFYNETDQSVANNTYSELEFDQTYYDVGDWRYEDIVHPYQYFAAPAGLAYMRIQAGAQFKRADNGAIPTSTTMFMIITNPADSADTIANFSLRGSGIVGSDPTVGNFLDSIYLTTGWRDAVSGSEFAVRVHHNYTSSLIVTRAWITIEGV